MGHSLRNAGVYRGSPHRSGVLLVGMGPRYTHEVVPMVPEPALMIDGR